MFGVSARLDAWASQVLAGYSLHPLGVVDAAARLAEALYPAHFVLSEFGQLWRDIDSTAHERLPRVEDFVEVLGRGARHYEAHLSASSCGSGVAGWVGCAGKGWGVWVGVALCRGPGCVGNCR